MIIPAAVTPTVDHHMVGLCRVSTDSQDNQLQRDALTQAGCGRIFEEKISTRKTDRPGMAAALDHLRPHAGDSLCRFPKSCARIPEVLCTRCGLNHP